MPILVVPGTTPVAPPFARAPRPQPNRTAAQWTWVTPLGETLRLSDDLGPIYMQPGAISGHMLPAVAAQESQPPGLDGGIRRGQKIQPRDLSVALTVAADSIGEWYDALDQLTSSFFTTDTPGVLVSRRYDGTERMVTCYYEAGLEAPDDGDPGGVLFGTFVIELRAYDPWWYGPAERRTFQPGATGGFPWPPIVIQSTELIGSGSVVTNPGDVEAFPVWTLTGPLASVTATAEDGSSWTVTKTLDPGESILVDTDPRASALRRVIDQSGQNLWGIATPDYPNLWPLPPGESTIEVDVSGSSAATRIQMEFNPRYRTA